MRTGPATADTISRTFDGALHLRELAEEIREETTVAQGSIEGSLYETAAAQGSTSAITGQAAKLFAHKIDFSRDIKDGDTFKLVFTRKVTESGRTVEAGDLLYAEVDAGKKGGQPLRFYRYQPAGGGEAQYFDETGKNIRGFLLQTPLAVVRITSGFGVRRHPVLGYNKMHQGIDFAGATGTPIYAAGDGVVAESGRKGGYGNWIMLKHSGGWETGYAHMSRYAPGMRRGVRVKQGQLIGYVGATGRVTGPHLHYEVMRNGARVNPKGTKIAGGQVLSGPEMAEFKRQKAGVDAVLAKADNSPTQSASAMHMRPTQMASR
jgi:murein DD-endopeptidase MepM/ murein hydrolase activator NlpD